MTTRLRVLAAVTAALLPAFTGVAVARPMAHPHHHHARHHVVRHNAIPQHNRGDHDGDNHGAPSDGDGNL